MPSFQDHYEHSRHNLEFLESFFLKSFNDWAITVMFYTSVHIVEALLEREYSIHCRNHRERAGNLAKLDSFPTNAYRALEREAHNSRYKSYKIYDWEAYRFFKDYFQKLIHWFNDHLGETQALNIRPCKDINDEWYKKYKAKDPECNKYH
ncbi:MAG: hypothetical protein LBQ87_09810 [Candidatus Fibromonas sp.]|nr:hypothetical protein [Candidatus Fibromonas sp.]